MQEKDITSIEKIRLKLEEYFELMPALYLKFFGQEAIIKATNSHQYNSIPQIGLLYFESRDITHFVLPTNKLNKDVTPYEYEHKVQVYNIKSNLWDTVYEGLSHKCIEYVLRFQEAKYNFSSLARTEAQIELQKVEEYFRWTGELFTEEENDVRRARITEIVEGVKRELEIEDDSKLPQMDPEKAKQQSVERSRVRAERRKLYEEEIAKQENKDA